MRASRYGIPNRGGRGPNISRRRPRPPVISCEPTLVNWLMGVERTYWYAWDNHNWSTLDLTTASGNQMTAVGRSYGVIRHWMLGSILHSCSRERSGVWICQFDQKESKSWILWSAGGPIQFSVPLSWGVKQIRNWTGDALTPTNQLLLSSAPLLLTNAAQ